MLEGDGGTEGGVGREVAAGVRSINDNRLICRETLVFDFEDSRLHIFVRIREDKEGARKTYCSFELCINFTLTYVVSGGDQPF